MESTEGGCVLRVALVVVPLEAFLKINVTLYIPHSASHDVDVSGLRFPAPFSLR